MAFLDLPTPVQRFLSAIEARDVGALMATLRADAVLTDGDDLHANAAIPSWFESGLFRRATVIRPISRARRIDHVVVTMLTDEVGPGGLRTDAEHDWCLSIRADLIGAVEVRRRERPRLRPPVDAFVRATNLSDLDALIATFHEEAILNDQLRHYRGRSCIRAWATDEVIGPRLTMCVTQSAELDPHVTLVAEVDGEFDKRGLPDPLRLTFYLTVRDALITQLIILRLQT